LIECKAQRRNRAPIKSARAGARKQNYVQIQPSVAQGASTLSTPEPGREKLKSLVSWLPWCPAIDFALVRWLAASWGDWRSRHALVETTTNTPRDFPSLDTSELTDIEDGFNWRPEGLHWFLGNYT